MKIVGLVIARMGSSRLPGKSLADVAGRPLIARIIGRMLSSRLFDEVVLASPDGDADRPLLAAGEAAGATPFAGSENDVLDRFYRAARSVGADVIVHIGGDCPFPDHDLMRRSLDVLRAEGADFVSNLERLTYPAGLDTDAITVEALERMWQRATLTTNRVHCLSYIHQNPSQFVTRSFEHSEDLGHLRWTLDYPEDLEFTRRVYAALGPDDRYFGMASILDLLARHPEIARINSHLSDFSPGQPAYWDSEGYMTDLRGDLVKVVAEAVAADAALDHRRAAEKYAVAETLLADLRGRAAAFAR